MTAAVDASALYVLGELGDGGQGIVRRVAVPQSATPVMAFKEYKADPLGEVQWSVLEDLIRLPDELDDEARQWLADNTAWPDRVVTRDGVPVGFLMRLTPPECTVPLRMPGGAKPQLLGLEYLLNPLDYLAERGLAVSPRTRLMILSSLASALVRLHGQRISVGDLSPKNIVVAMKPSPRCFLIDCDAVRRGDDSVLPQVETPDWGVPAGEPLATPAGDVYKLALLAVRLMASDQATTDVGYIPAGLPDLVDVTRRTLESAPAARPAAADWVTVLDRTIPLASPMAPAPPPPTAPTATPTAPVRGPVVGAPVGTPAPAPTRSRAGVWAAVAALVLLVGCVGLVAIASAVRPSQQTATTTQNDGYVPPAAEPYQPPVEQTRTQPTEIGQIDIGAVTTDSRASDVGRFLDSYYSAINRHNITDVLEHYDPASSIGKLDSAGQAKFARDLSTTTDTGMRIERLEAGTDGATVVVSVTFQSTQQSGYGPARAPAETCTRWSVTYSLSEPSPGDYHILRGSGTSQPC